MSTASKKILRRVPEDKRQSLLKHCVSGVMQHCSGAIHEARKDLPPFLRSFFTQRSTEIRAAINEVSMPTAVKTWMHSFEYWEKKDEQADLKAWVKMAWSQYGEILYSKEMKEKLVVIGTPEVIADQSNETNGDTVFKKNPRCWLLVDCGEDFQIEKGFIKHCPFSVKRIAFTGKNIHTICGPLFQCFPHIKRVNLDGLENLSEIGDNFLSDCQLLEWVSLDRSTQIRKIGTKCLSSCHNLRVVKLRGLTAVRSVGNSFLDGCRNIQSVLTVPNSFVDKEVRKQQSRLIPFINQ